MNSSVEYNNQGQDLYENTYFFLTLCSMYIQDPFSFQKISFKMSPTSFCIFCIFGQNFAYFAYLDYFFGIFYIFYAYLGNFEIFGAYLAKFSDFKKETHFLNPNFWEKFFSKFFLQKNQWLAGDYDIVKIKFFFAFYL